MAFGYFAIQMFDFTKGVNEDIRINKNLVIPDSIKVDSNSYMHIGRISESTVVLPDGALFETNLYDFKLIGEIETQTKFPYLILSGRQCENCDANISIYIQCPSDGSLKPEHEQERYSYPGHLYSFMQDSLIFESRMFFGEVLDNRNGVIWYQKELLDNKNWVETVYFVEIRNDTLVAITITANIKLTLKQVERGNAKELDGLDFTEAP